MSIASNIIFTIDEIFRSAARALGQVPEKYVDLVTAEDDFTLVGADGSYATMIAVSGTKKLVGAEEFDQLINTMHDRLTPILRRRGHMLQFMFMMDPDPNEGEVSLSDMIRRMRSTGKRLGLDVEDVLDERERVLRRYCVSERMLLTVWTRPTLLAPGERKDARVRQRKEDKGSLQPQNAQPYLRGFRGLLERHRSLATSIVDDLGKAGVLAQKLEVHAALREARASIDPDMTPREWRPVLPQDPPHIRVSGEARPDVSDLMWPTLDQQMIPRDPIIHDMRTVQVGGRIYAPISMTYAPKTMQPFSQLIANTREYPDMPWRISIMIEGGGMELGDLSSRYRNADLLGFASRRNKIIRDAFENLRHLDEVEGEAVVGLRVDLATWAPENEPDLLRKRMENLSACFIRWGGPEATQVTGSPLHALLSSGAATRNTSVSEITAAPLRDILTLLPLTRPASPWKYSNMLLRTPEGKLYPFQSYSSLQEAWVTSIMAPMGSGKSVHMNAYNLGLVLDEGNDSLPYIRIQDIGPSSSGFVMLLAGALPPDKRHLVAYHRLRMDPQFSINPFDTPLGCRKPLPGQTAFLRNFLCLLATPLGSDVPDDAGISGIAQQVIEMAYTMYSPENTPKPYKPGMDVRVDAAIADTGLHLDARTSWWEIVDALAAKGRTHEATLAQRFAVPLLDEIARIANMEQLQNVYEGSAATGERITKYFWRTMTEAINKYPILARPTRFDLGEARIVSLDLDEVAPKGGADAQRQSAVMYTLALWILAGEFFVGEDILYLIPEQHRGYHQKRISELRRVKKRLCADEFHRCATAPSALAAVEQIIREGRKWRVDVTLCSQEPHDFTDTMIDLTTTAFILGSGMSGARSVAERFQLSNTAIYNIEHRVKGPGPAGANMLAVFKTKQDKFVNVLTNTLGPIELWAFSTTAEDRQLRDRLYVEMDPVRARRLLAKRFPGGSAQKELEQREASRKEFISELGQAKKSVFEEVLDELRELAKTLD